MKVWLRIYMDKKQDVSRYAFYNSRRIEELNAMIYHLSFDLIHGKVTTHKAGMLPPFG